MLLNDKVRYRTMVQYVTAFIRENRWNTKQLLNKHIGRSIDRYSSRFSNLNHTALWFFKEICYEEFS